MQSFEDLVVAVAGMANERSPGSRLWCVAVGDLDGVKMATLLRAVPELAAWQVTGERAFVGFGVRDATPEDIRRREMLSRFRSRIQELSCRLDVAVKRLGGRVPHLSLAFSGCTREDVRSLVAITRGPVLVEAEDGSWSRIEGEVVQ